MATDRISRRGFVEVVGGSAALLAAGGAPPAVAVAASDKVRIGRTTIQVPLHTGRKMLEASSKP